ncbi:hypothetical protein ZIOFF_040903 [Zingiber officinale]|uniref:Retroviral polymerase SH3-like domain-containing protein n=1 Tax=Zingiber officinale TaxID=94328 RepID=A0A8J5GD34_ZINOF|nr:hypothetical protein ZIOFF_040903 [Zingiber officinale]
MDIVRSMMKAKSMPKEFWAEVVSCVVHVLNRCPSRSIQKNTPYELWSGKKPNISHLKVFGCVAYAHVPDAIQKKLDDKANKCIFIGYSSETKGYKLFNPDTGKAIISRDVTFDEQGVWDWKKEEPESPQPRAPMYMDGVDEREEQTQQSFSDSSTSGGRPRRESQLPTCLNDYVVGDTIDHLTDEDVVNFTLFANCDPVDFKDVVAYDRWVKAMPKRILRYIKGTQGDGILYSKGQSIELLGYTDSDWVGDTVERKSTSGYAFFIGSGVFSWSSKKQLVIALSTAEAEYIAASNCATQAVWLRRMLGFLQHKQDDSTMVFCDNKSTIELTKNPVFHGRSKHIDIKYHFIRDLVRENEIAVNYCKSEDQVADIFTKGLKMKTLMKLK